MKKNLQNSTHEVYIVFSKFFNSPIIPYNVHRHFLICLPQVIIFHSFFRVSLHRFHSFPNVLIFLLEYQTP